MSLPVRPEVTEVTYWRKPTPSEVRFGHGAIHYRVFPVEQCVRLDGSLKHRMKAKDDGQWYFR